MSIRTEKISSLVRHVVGEYLTRIITTPPYNFTTIAEVSVSPDLKHAKIYVSIFGDEESRRSTFKYLVSKRNEVKHILGKQLQTKFTPDLLFIMDDTLDKVDRLEKIFKEIHKND